MDLLDKNISRKSVFVINGPNLNLLGRRDRSLYGSLSLDEVNTGLKIKFGDRVNLCFFQSNHEGTLIDMIQAAGRRSDCLGIVINPGAYAHTSLALADALADYAIQGHPYIEVHISDILSREPLRRSSLTACNALKMISGHGTDGYSEAVDLLLQKS